MMNTGTMIWNESEKIRLGAAGDSAGDAAKFGIGRVLLPAGTDVKGIVNNQAVEDQYWFRFTMTAPQTPGLYKPSFRMIRENGQWFGPALTVPILVKAPQAPVPPYNSSIISWEIPGATGRGQQVHSAITVMNTGSGTWSHGYQQPWSSGDVGMNTDLNRIDPINFSVTNNGNAMIECTS